MADTLRIYVLYGLKPSKETTWGRYLNGIQWKRLMKLNVPLKLFSPASLNKDFLRWLHESTYTSFKERTGQDYGYIRLNGFSSTKRTPEWEDFGTVKVYPEGMLWQDHKQLLYIRFAQIEMMTLRQKLMRRDTDGPDNPYDELVPPLD